MDSSLTCEGGKSTLLIHVSFGVGSPVCLVLGHKDYGERRTGTDSKSVQVRPPSSSIRVTLLVEALWWGPGATYLDVLFSGRRRGSCLRIGTSPYQGETGVGLRVETNNTTNVRV